MRPTRMFMVRMANIQYKVTPKSGILGLYRVFKDVIIHGDIDGNGDQLEAGI